MTRETAEDPSQRVAGEPGDTTERNGGPGNKEKHSDWCLHLGILEGPPDLAEGGL